MVNRIIKEEPVLIKKLKARKTILPRPFRELYLDFAEDVAEQLRSRDFWVSMTASQVAHIAISAVLSMLGIEAIIKSLKRW